MIVQPCQHFLFVWTIVLVSTTNDRIWSCNAFLSWSRIFPGDLRKGSSQPTDTTTTCPHARKFICNPGDYRLAKRLWQEWKGTIFNKEDGDSPISLDMSDKQASLLTSNNDMIHFIHHWKQLAGMLSELIDPNKDPADQVSILQAWRESRVFRNASDATLEEVHVPMNRTKVESWKDYWIESMNNEDVKDVGDHIWRYLIGDWSKVRQNKILIHTIRAVCVVFMTWGFVTNILTSVIVSGVWTWTTLKQPTAINWDVMRNPSLQHRQVLLESYSNLRLCLDPLLFGMTCVGTALLLPYYENMVCTVESIVFSAAYRERYPLISRLQGLFITFLLSIVVVHIMTVMGMFSGTCLGVCKRWIFSASRKR